MIEIVHTNDIDDARRLDGEGWEPVECSFGVLGAVVGRLGLDHHGERSARSGVAWPAYRDHFAARRADPRFVVTGQADADATFAIAAVAGVLPHPSRLQDPEAPPEAGQDLGLLAELVATTDVQPIGVRLLEHAWGPLLLLWNQLASQAPDATAFHAGVDRWRHLALRPPQHLLQAARVGEAARLEAARGASVERVSDRVVLVESTVWGFDVWYAELAPVVVVWNPERRSSAIGCPGPDVARTLFGPGGLKAVYPHLEPLGWGGREAIGGAPRGVAMTRALALAAARAVAARVVAAPPT